MQVITALDIIMPGSQPNVSSKGRELKVTQKFSPSPRKKHGGSKVSEKTSPSPKKKQGGQTHKGKDYVNDTKKTSPNKNKRDWQQSELLFDSTEETLFNTEEMTEQSIVFPPRLKKPVLSPRKHKQERNKKEQTYYSSEDESLLQATNSESLQLQSHSPSEDENAQHFPSGSDADMSDATPDGLDAEPAKAAQGTKKCLTAKGKYSLRKRQEEELLNWIKDNEFVYRRDAARYKEKHAAWQKKAEQMGLPVEHLNKWFKNNRDQFRKLTKTQSGQAKKRLTERERWVVTNFEFLSCKY